MLTADVVDAIKLWRIKCVEHAESVRGENSYKLQDRNMKEKDITQWCRSEANGYKTDIVV